MDRNKKQTYSVYSMRVYQPQLKKITKKVWKHQIAIHLWKKEIKNLQQQIDSEMENPLIKEERIVLLLSIHQQMIETMEHHTYLFFHRNKILQNNMLFTA